MSPVPNQVPSPDASSHITEQPFCFCSATACNVDFIPRAPHYIGLFYVPFYHIRPRQRHEIECRRHHRAAALLLLCNLILGTVNYSVANRTALIYWHLHYFLDYTAYICRAAVSGYW